jgi:peptidoglycan hydrolase-like protein with peptidoglycan-binding domain
MLSQPLLAYGSRGSAVAEVQRDLHISADGIFGPQTRAAVIAFQRAHGFLVDGIVGPQTWGGLQRFTV